MTDEQKEQYIELQRQAIIILWGRYKAHTMEEIEAMRRLEEFEDTLPCNQLTPGQLEP